jgi:small subunit ribosomal protein S16
MLIIRLARLGKRNEPHFRMVVADNHRAVQKKIVELVGHYHPSYPEEKQLVLNTDRILYWMSKGAQLSDTVEDILYKQGIGDLPKRKFFPSKPKKDEKSEKVEKAGGAKKEVEKPATEAAPAEKKDEKKAEEKPEKKVEEKKDEKSEQK